VSSLKIGIAAKTAISWPTSQLLEALAKRGVDRFVFPLSKVALSVEGNGVKAQAFGVDLSSLDAAIVRPIGRSTLDQGIFRLDILHTLERLGVVVINKPSAIERAVDKFQALSILAEHGVKVPKTVVTEEPDEAIRALKAFNVDAVLKPLFGSRGIGVSRLVDEDVAERIFRTLKYMRCVLYVQEFIPHHNRDIRLFVVGDRVIAGMYREALNWKTNVAQGAKPKPLKPSEELAELALRACKALGCEVAGVDILEGPDGMLVTEVNSQPGWRGLQSVTKVNIAEAIVDYVIEKVKRG